MLGHPALSSHPALSHPALRHPVLSSNPTLGSNPALSTTNSNNPASVSKSKGKAKTLPKVSADSC